MNVTVPVSGCWPISDQAWHFDLGHVLNSAVLDAIEPQQTGALAIHHAGLWECDLRDDTLIWSGGVYDMFGLKRGLAISREMALEYYSEHSRAALTRMRAYAIRNRCGFTLDAEIHAGAERERRRIRVIAAPVCIDDVVVRLHGVKLII